MDKIKTQGKSVEEEWVTEEFNQNIMAKSRLLSVIIIWSVIYILHILHQYINQHTTVVISTPERTNLCRNVLL